MILSILKKVIPVPKLTAFNRYLFVGPHPDDIEISSGGTVKRLTEMGKNVTFLIATDGSVGCIDPDVPASQLAATRQQEARASAAILGVTDVRFLPFGDGGDYDQSDMTAAILACILDTQPDVIFAPDHKAVNECHPDHLNVGKATADAYLYSLWGKITARFGHETVAHPVAIAYYYTERPNTYVKVSRQLKAKFAAIRCHTSQFDERGFSQLELYNHLSLLRHGLPRLKGKAEAFRALNNTQQHCLPEGSNY
jgi:LmbE family N-acetylglucosaminyl deacetylase